jgi:uncharacterized protein (UPF0335 family)
MDKSTAAQLLSIVERVEALHAERKTLEDDIRDVYAEAKSTGFDVKAIKDIVKRRREDTGKLQEHEAIVETYLAALEFVSRGHGSKSSSQAQPQESQAVA